MPANITITYSLDWAEYRVPGPAGTEAQAYYTDDREDAEDTAKAVYGSCNNLARCGGLSCD